VGQPEVEGEKGGVVLRLPPTSRTAQRSTSSEASSARCVVGRVGIRQAAAGRQVCWQAAAYARFAAILHTLGDGGRSHARRVAALAARA